jgi:hypothetical protein
MSFTAAGSDNPFNPGTNLTNFSYDPTIDLADYVTPNVPSEFCLPLFEGLGFNEALGVNTTINSTTRDIELVSSGGGGSSRPTSGMVYPRLT